MTAWAGVGCARAPQYWLNLRIAFPSPATQGWVLGIYSSQFFFFFFTFFFLKFYFIFKLYKLY